MFSVRVEGGQWMGASRKQGRYYPQAIEGEIVTQRD